MSTYARRDFSESMDRTTITPDKIQSVIAAWGESTEDCGEWSGGFMLLLKDGMYAYLTGWCDTTGWGCQDGADLTFYQQEPEWRKFKCSKYREDLADWDESPADLNKWLAEGAPHDKVY